MPSLMGAAGCGKTMAVRHVGNGFAAVIAEELPTTTTGSKLNTEVLNHRDTIKGEERREKTGLVGPKHKYFHTSSITGRWMSPFSGFSFKANTDCETASAVSTAAK